jgi:hypothetical protein
MIYANFGLVVCILLSLRWTSFSRESTPPTPPPPVEALFSVGFYTFRGLAAKQIYQLLKIHR